MFQDLFNKILSQQLTHDKSYIDATHTDTKQLQKQQQHFPLSASRKGSFRVPTWDPPTFYHVAEMAINIWKGHVIN